MGKSTISMAIFNCYVSLPEGNIFKPSLPHVWMNFPFLDQFRFERRSVEGQDVSGCGQDWRGTSSQFTKRCGQHRPVVFPLFNPLYIYMFLYYILYCIFKILKSLYIYISFNPWIYHLRSKYKFLRCPYVHITSLTHIFWWNLGWST